MAVVGNAVRRVDNLGFQRRLLGSIRLAGPKPLALQDFVAEVQPREAPIAVFQQLDDPQSLLVVRKATFVGQEGVQGVLAGVSKGGMADVVQ